MYSFSKGLKKALLGLLYFGLPFILTQAPVVFPYLNQLSLSDIFNLLIDKIYPNLGNLSLGAIILLIANYFKTKKVLAGRYQGEINKRKEN